MPSLNAKLAASFAPLAGAILLSATPASAETDFFFHYTDTELSSFIATKRLYRRLQHEASQICEETGRREAAQDACVNDLIGRVVAGINDKGLTKYHEKRA